MLDDPSSRKRDAVRKAIREAGAHIFFLPPYSPELTPVEQLFAKPERLMRRAGERTKEGAWRQTGTLLDQLAPRLSSRPGNAKTIPETPDMRMPNRKQR